MVATGAMGELALVKSELSDGRLDHRTAGWDALRGGLRRSAGV